MKRALLIWSFLLFIGPSLFAQTSEKPNVIFIVIDDLNDYVNGFGGQLQIETPNIDRLIAHGYLFTNGFCNAPVCAPSRTSFLSGKDLFYTKVYDNNNYLDEFRNNFTAANNNEEVITLPEQLKDAGGYFTYGINKVFHDPWNKDWDTTTNIPCDKTLSWNKVVSFSDDPVIDSLLQLHNEGLQSFKWSMVDDSLDYRMKDARGTDTAIQFILNVADGTQALCDSVFFLALGYDLPHLDLNVPEKYFPDWYVKDIYAADFDIPYNYPANSYPVNGLILPPQPETRWSDYYALGPLGKAISKSTVDVENGVTNYTDSLEYLPEINPSLTDSMRWEIIAETKRANAVMAYMAGVQDVDYHIGRFLDVLDEHPEIKNNTIIILIGDNGFSFGEKHHWQKRSFWESDVRVPFVIVDPSRPGNVICDRTVSLLDLYPTICDMTSTPYPLFSDGSHYLDGKSIVPLLNDPAASWERPVLISFEQEDNKECSCFTQYAVRSEKFKYIRYASDGGNPYSECNADSSFTEEELYEIGAHRETDPNEWKNLIGNSDYAPVKAYLQQWLPDSAMYHRQTISLHITQNELPCFLSQDDQIELHADIFDTLGNAMLLPVNMQCLWTNNLTNDTISGQDATFPINNISEVIFDAHSELIFYCTIYRAGSDVMEAFDLHHFYLNYDHHPVANYSITRNEFTYTVNDFYISGSYSAYWWVINGDSVLINTVPGPITLEDTTTASIECMVQYGNTDCTEAFESTSISVLNNNHREGSLAIYPDPADQETTLQINDANFTSWMYIYDVNGRRIREIDLRSYPYNKYVLNTSLFTNGIYFIYYFTDRYQLAADFIVQH